MVKTLRVKTEDGYTWFGVPEEYDEFFRVQLSKLGEIKSEYRSLLNERAKLKQKITLGNEKLNKLESRIKRAENKIAGVEGGKPKNK